MNALEFNFSEEKFNRLFPFYILIDESLQIKSFGKGFAKICPYLEKLTSFIENFDIARPHFENPTFDAIISNSYQLIILKSTKNNISLRGQFEIIDNLLLFVGSPWFDSMHEVVDKKLTLRDFALHDPQIDLLHLLNNQQNASAELKELLTLVNNQKNKLKQANKEIHDIALFPMQNPDPLIRIDTDGNLLKRNPSAEKLSSFEYENVHYSPVAFFKFIIHKINVDNDRWIFEVYSGDKTYSFICISLKEEGYINIYGRDVTEQKKDQEELNRLSLVASANENGVVFTKPTGEIIWCNEAYLSLTGFSREEIIGKTPIEIGKCKETSDEETLKMTIPFLNRDVFDVEHLHRRKNDSNFWVKTKGQPIKNSNGEVTQYFAMIEDVSLKKNYEEVLKNERNKYSNIIANMNLGLLEVDINDVIMLANNSFCEISGFGIEELIGVQASKLLVTEEYIDVLEIKNNLRKKGINDSYELEVLNKKGEKRNWLISAAPNYDVNGEIVGSIGIHLDITEKKEQEEQLYLLSLIAEKNINSVVILDKEGKIEWVNSSFELMSGYSNKELVGKKPGSLLQGPETNPEAIKYLKDQISKGHPFNCEIINYSKSGEKYWVRIQGQTLYNKNGEISKFFAIEENISNQKLLENQREELAINLAKTNKELEDFAQIVSHDLKSPLQSIHSLISWIKEDNDKEFNSQTLEYLSMVENKVEKMDHLIDGILTYSKIDKGNVLLENVDTHQIIQGIIDIIYIPQNVTITIKNKLPVLKAGRYRIQQLFQNLIGNAVNYIEHDSGFVEVSSQEFDYYYVFSIKDNGVGIDKKNHCKIFNTFQSYTSSQKSTGLGLSIVKKIIEVYKGEIWLESELGVGTTFFVKLNK